MSLSDFGIRVIVASENELGSTSTSIFCKSLGECVISFLNVEENSPMKPIKVGVLEGY